MGIARKNNKTILLLDDEQPDRARTAQFLHDAGYRVLEADSYRTALATFTANAYVVDLLVADISLPDGNGCELAIELGRQRPELRVLFVSGHVGAEVCRFYGLDVTDLHFLRKPFRNEELLLAVRRILDSEMAFPPLMKTLGGGAA